MNVRVVLQRVGLGALVLGVLTTPWWGPPLLSTFDFFRVRRVEFVGLRYGDAGQLTELLALDSTASVWMPLEPLEARVTEHPMVIAARVSRKLPATFRIVVEERVAIALVSGPEGLSPVDASGQPLPIDPTATPVDVPVVATPDSALFALLDRIRADAPALWSRLSSARRRGPRDYQLMLDDLSLRTPADVTVARLRDILPVEADLARRRLRATELDLRYRDQVIARLP